ncbi:MAG TPA: hypothetical protein VNL14_13230 [Candidatus Acidoferrales bacterium]|nr:hypothetical protein [Candidatus Acidoferrales bacterium]
MRIQDLPIWRIEAWHALLAAGALAAIVPARFLDPWAFVLGSLFMGGNFLLLGLGLRWTLAPLAEKGRVRAGVCLLVLKMALFLGLISLLFTRVSLDGLSFAAGVSCLLAAILAERFWSGAR